MENRQPHTRTHLIYAVQVRIVEQCHVTPEYSVVVVVDRVCVCVFFSSSVYKQWCERSYERARRHTHTHKTISFAYTQYICLIQFLVL